MEEAFGPPEPKLEVVVLEEGVPMTDAEKAEWDAMAERVPDLVDPFAWMDRMRHREDKM